MNKEEFKVINGGGRSDVPHALDLRVRRLIGVINGERIYVDRVMMYPQYRRNRTDSSYNPQGDAPIRA